MTIAFIAVFGLSVSGWISLLSRRMSAPLIPAFFFAAVGSVLTLAGILNVLPYAAWGIELFGAAYFLWKICRKSERAAV